MSRVDRWLGAVLIVLALVWLWLVQTQIPDAGEEWPGPRGFPLLLGVVLAILGVWMILFPGSRTPDPGSRGHELAVAAGTFGVLVLYAFLLERVGFLLATPVVIALAMAGLLRMRRLAAMLSLAAGFTLGCWAIFEALLGTPLPRGAWRLW
ncbi:MAG: tripartite tricarboxylate transporter TctB family protein [Acidobacteria bacterium]|nr:tripartite tricarboxylate transporter TctB family protein [Acidobacteriota bacterium]